MQRSESSHLIGGVHIRTSIYESLGCCFILRPQTDMQGSAALGIGTVQGGTASDQTDDYIALASNCGQMQRRAVSVIQCVGIGARTKQSACGGGVTAQHGDVQRCVALAVAAIDVGLDGGEHAEHVGVTALRRGVQCSEAGVRRQVDGGLPQEQRADVGVPAQCGHHQRSAAFGVQRVGVDVRVLREQTYERGATPVCGKVESGDLVLVAGVHLHGGMRQQGSGGER
mmetsp:Transcript_10588/g.26694  ORF Transcript_10588/g.26694 Transcript_10588/m.26694 type:complete len:227 (-) Transcript_10588:3055-3735(-)